MAGTRHIDDLVHLCGSVIAFFPGLGFHRQLIRDFLVQAQGQLFAGDFRRDHPHRQVRDLVFGIQPGAFGQGRGQPVAQLVAAIALLDRKSVV